MSGDIKGTELTTAISQDLSLLNFIASAVRDPTIDINKLESLMRIQRELAAQMAQQDFNRCMSEAQSEMRPIVRDATNNQTHSRYARLETIDELIRPIYTRHGFSLTFGTEPAADPVNIRVTCEAAHSSGHTKKYSLEAPPDTAGAKGQVNKTPLHGLGSTVSYLRRYLTTMIFNVTLTNEDDDGNGGGRSSRHPEPSHPLEEPNGTKWLKNLYTLLHQAMSEAEVVEIAGHPSVEKSLASERTPSTIKALIQDYLNDAYTRFKVPNEDAANEPEPDEVDDFLGRLKRMSRTEVDRLDTNAEHKAWLKGLSEADAKRVIAGIADRYAARMGA